MKFGVIMSAIRPVPYSDSQSSPKSQCIVDSPRSYKSDDTNEWSNDVK